LTLDDVLPALEARLHAISGDVSRPQYSDFDLTGAKPEAPLLKPAAVLVPLVSRPSGLNLILTKRASHLSAHAGQIAFPGGRREDGDLDFGATALREAYEEIGLDPHYVRLLGMSDAYETVTRFAVTPVIGLVDAKATFQADPNEVETIFEVPFSFVMDSANHLPQSRTYNGVARQFYAMPYGEHYIWGATAGMLRALYLRLFG
jgi:8-oxo-dGTP pyrophosphatase MutT (NUDIX family)